MEGVGVAGAKKGFVIWDTRIEGVRGTLRRLVKQPPYGFAEVEILGLDDGAGAVWEENVRPGIEAADHLLALLDLPNANVGYEIGYALALGKAVRLAVYGDDQIPPWCDRAPLRSQLVARAPGVGVMRELFVDGRGAAMKNRPAPGDVALLLCPEVGDGEAAIEQVKALRPDWRVLPRDGWSLLDLPEKLAGVGRVIWIVAPFPHRSQERDGEENAAASVVAGYAAGCGLEVHVWRNKEARQPIDVAGRMNDYVEVEELDELVERLDQPPEERGTSADLLAVYRRFLRHRHRNLVSFFEGDGLGDVYVELTIDAADERSVRPEDRLKTGTLRRLLDELGPTARITVLGDPGAGKSTVCRRLCFDLAGELKDAPDGPVPVFVPLFRLAAERGRDVFALAEGDVRDDGAAGLANELRRLAKETDRVRLLLDGLDEVPEAAVDDVRGHIAELAEEYPRLRIAVTARKIGYARLGGFRTATLRELDEAGQRKLLQNWLGPEKGAAVHADVRTSPSMAEPARNPLLLSLIAFLAREQGGLPPTRVALYDRATTTLLERGHGARATNGVRSPTSAWPILAGLSLRLQESEGESWTKAELLEQLEALLYADGLLANKLKLTWTEGPESFLDDVAVNAGLLADHGDQNGRWRFLHRSLREALAAEALAKRGPEEVTEQAARLAEERKKEDAADVERRLAHWGETFALVCGRQGTPEAALALLKRLREASPALALRALPNVDGLDAQSVFPFLDGLEEWDGDDLLGIVRRLVGRGEDRGVVREELVRRVDAESSLDRIAWTLYALEGGGILDPADDAGREAFFDGCGLGRKQRRRPRIRRVKLPPDGDEATFWMGSAEGVGDDDEHPRHRVTLSPFAIGTTAVTNGEYSRLDDRHECPGGRNHPVTEVSWWRAWLFCRWLGGALPTEAQWEYACRAGADGENDLWCFGGDEKRLGKYAWYDENSKLEAHPVGKKLANRFGLYDMHGNVFEWCADWFGAFPDESASVANPTGPPRGSSRVLRGGYAWFGADWARSACRNLGHPGGDWLGGGFRVAFPSPAPRSRGSKLDP